MTPSLPVALQRFFTSVPKPVAAFDHGGKVLFANPRWTSIPATCTPFDECIASACAGTPIRCAFDGGEVGQILLFMPWYDDGGGVGGAIVAVEEDDHTIRERLRSNEAFARALFERSQVGLNLCRMDGLWVESNQAFLDIIGYTRGGRRRPHLLGADPRHYDALEAVQLERLSKEGVYGPYEKEFIRKDGTLVPVRLNGFLIERGGERFIWSLIEDIRAERELERQVDEERRKSIHASRLATIGEMAAGIAHEVNNPLAIIEVVASELAVAVDEGDMDFVREAVGMIRESTERAARIVRGLGKLARRDSGPEAPVVAHVVEEALGMCRHRLAAFGVELEVSLDSARATRADSAELAQVFINLFNNAFDAVRKQPSPRVIIAVDDVDRFVRVVVADNGPGIPGALRDRVFEPFFTTKPPGEGTGLGLSISRRIVEELGGELRHDASAPGARLEVLLRSAS